jgi:ADP-ribose pyrophosphatase YjhB (NUDIX family)
MFASEEGVIKPIVYIGIVRGDELLMVDYITPPNPNKEGWWIPAPGLEFGEDPAEVAEKTVREFGFEPNDLSLHDVESFVMPGGWHLIYHYRAHVKGEPAKHENVREYRWVNADQLNVMPNVAHGKWEVSVGRSYLEARI